MEKLLNIKIYLVSKLVNFAPDMNALATIRDLLNYKIFGPLVVDKVGRLVEQISWRDVLKQLKV